MVYQSIDGYWIAHNGTDKRRFDTYQEAMMSLTPSAAQEWETYLRAIIQQARGLVTEAQSLSLLAQTNEIETIIATTPDGDYLPDTSIRKEDAALRAAAFQDMLSWLQGQATGAPEGVTRLQVIFKRF